MRIATEVICDSAVFPRCDRIPVANLINVVVETLFESANKPDSSRENLISVIQSQCERKHRRCSPCLWNNLPASFRQPQAHSSSETNITPSITSSLFHSDLKRTCSTNPSHHRSSSYPPTAHWTSTGLPSRTSYHPALKHRTTLRYVLVHPLSFF